MNNDKYIEACLRGCLDDIEAAPQGTSNDTLNIKAFRLYQAVGAGQLSDETVTGLLNVSAQNRNIPSTEIRDTLKSARNGITNPLPFWDSSNTTPYQQSDQSIIDKFDDLEALDKQKKSISWFERISDNVAEVNHPYLVKKKLTGYRDCFFIGEDKKGRFLAYDLTNEQNNICGFGRIYKDGEKRNTAGSGATGTYYAQFIGNRDGNSVCYITEGAADACSVMAVTGCDAYAAISSGTMLKVAELFKGKYKEVICCLDNDNAGLKVGNKLVEAGFKCVIPKDSGKDFSDVYCTGGADLLNEQLNNLFISATDKESLLLSLDSFAITNIEEMRSMLNNDNWVLHQIALMGQITILFAKPNSGKTLITLKMLIDTVKAGGINGKDIYYLNCDDTMRGLTTKAEIAAQYGIKMIASGYNGFKNSHLSLLLEQLTLKDEAKGKVLILDTLKKFSDLMNKTQSSEFNEVMRSFVSKGGTVIALAHTNKARDADGKVVFQGTSDSVDDADCCYTLDLVNVVDDSFQGMKMSTRTVLFENFKSRGDNVDKISYQYMKVDGESYQALIDSVKLVDEVETAKAEKQGRINQKLADHEEEIELIFDAIDAGINTTENIINFLMAESVSRAKAKKVLKEHTGNNMCDGHKWKQEKGDKNQRIFKRLF